MPLPTFPNLSPAFSLGSSKSRLLSIFYFYYISVYQALSPVIFTPKLFFCLYRSSCNSGISSSVTSSLTTQCKSLYCLHFLLCYGLLFYVICDPSVWNYLSYLSFINFCGPLSRKHMHIHKHHTCTHIISSAITGRILSYCLLILVPG